ncbi:MAG: lysylphosphatidylglycerol synthase transmembrane domain-containing protein [Candidatus Euphemobacter frigidus]|nr:lysylphosphatidylglycerol synthase transmembrane domain-containing protein [Candidatus Euphemobacter frigidus]MDP8276123.1 lysylphosphatidylglycerol synthase transmembrane domain-containing protein [Candidatus Euphemobacter frigidus]
MKKKIFNILRIVVSLGLIIFLVSYLDIGKIVDTASLIWSQHPGYLIVVVLGGLLLMILEAYRLQQVLRVQKIQLPLSRLTSYCFIGMFFNNILPTTIGGDVAKGFYIARDSGKKTEPFVALVVVRIIGAFCLTAVTVVALIIGYNHLPNSTPIYMVAALTLVNVFALLFFTRRKLAVKFLVLLKPFKNKTLRKEIIAVYRLFHSHRRFPLQLGLAALATLGIEFLYIYINFLIARGMGFTSVGFSSFMLLVPLIAVTTLVPSIGGLGIREGMYVWFFGNLIGEDGAGALSLIMMVFVLSLGLVGGLVYAVSGTLRKSRPEPPREDDFDSTGGEISIDSSAPKF